MLGGFSLLLRTLGEKISMYYSQAVAFSSHCIKSRSINFICIALGVEDQTGSTSPSSKQQQ